MSKEWLLDRKVIELCVENCFKAIPSLTHDSILLNMLWLVDRQDLKTKQEMGKLVDREFRKHPDLPLYYNRWQVLKEEIGL